MKRPTRVALPTGHRMVRLGEKLSGLELTRLEQFGGGVQRKGGYVTGLTAAINVFLGQLTSPSRQQRLRMRYEMFGLPIDEGRIAEITEGKIEPLRMTA